MQLKQKSKDSFDHSSKNGGQKMNISLFFKPSIMKVYSLLALFSFIVSMPLQVNAGFFDFITGADAQTPDTTTTDQYGTDNFTDDYNSQNYPLTETPINPDVKNIDQDDGAPIVLADALSSSTGLIGTGLESVSTGGITTYIVKEGDTLSQIAEDFDISPNTIRWENDTTGGNIKVGQTLSILPVTGVKHIIKKGDTLAGIADKYDADVNDIEIFNDISSNDGLKVGDILIVPNGTLTVQVSKPSNTTPSKTSETTPDSKTISSGYYMKPVAGPITSPYGSRRGGFHYGVDIGARYAPFVAAASGTVVSTVSSCREGQTSCGGRYGNYIVISHSNGQFTRYAHLSKVYVSVGQVVKKGKTIGVTGNTGHTTGPHLHFQIERASGSTIRPVF